MILRKMAKYKIVIKKSAAKEIKKLPTYYLNKILLKIGELSENPRPVEAVKLTNEEKYRIRVDVYRILYEIKENILTIIVVKVRHRKDVYN